MVVGNGLLAKAFNSYSGKDEFLIFASGVSNSKTSTGQDYQKEKQLCAGLLLEHPDKIFVYFSTCSIEDPDLKTTGYIKHKLEMENLIKQGSGHYYIFRLSNLAGFSRNKNTVLNFFNDHISYDLPFECWKNAERNIIDVEDVYRVADYIMKNKIRVNHITNIANVRNYTVPYIVRCIESFHQKKAMMTEKEKGVPFKIDVSDILPVCEELNIRFGNDYLPELLKKYYH
jgi:nucleoside-diphosphate-sugar epimerase